MKYLESSCIEVCMHAYMCVYEWVYDIYKIWAIYKMYVDCVSAYYKSLMHLVCHWMCHNRGKGCCVSVCSGKCMVYGDGETTEVDGSGTVA